MQYNLYSIIVSGCLLLSNILIVAVSLIGSKPYGTEMFIILILNVSPSSTIASLFIGIEVLRVAEVFSL